MDRRPHSPQHPGEDGPARRKIHDHKSCQACRDQNTNADRQASATQERTRLENMDQETFADHQATSTS